MKQTLTPTELEATLVAQIEMGADLREKMNATAEELEALACDILGTLYDIDHDAEAAYYIDRDYYQWGWETQEWLLKAAKIIKIL